MNPIFFKSQAEWRKWLEENHDKLTEVLVGYYKKHTAKPTITWPQSVDEALCFGWIDGVRKSIDENSYTIRFTPRRAKSIWSAVNIKRASELLELGLMHSAGLKVFNERDTNKSQQYSYETRPNSFDKLYEKQFKKNKQAWTFFNAQPPSYQRAAIWWVISAKQEQTKQKRIDTLIKDSEDGKTIPPLTRIKKKADI